MRSGGILMPITSLPSPWGVGTLGAEARAFVDFLVRAGVSVWQVLPIVPTSYGDSPYQSFSTYAGNPYLIDLDDLSLVGFDDISFSQFCVPRITTIRQDSALLAERSVRLLLAALRDGAPAAHEVVPFELVERESVRTV